MGIAHTILILDDLLTRRQRFLAEDSLITPRAIERAQPDITTTDGQ